MVVEFPSKVFTKSRIGPLSPENNKCNVFFEFVEGSAVLVYLTDKRESCFVNPGALGNLPCDHLPFSFPPVVSCPVSSETRFQYSL
jgi:hypothetical protein